MTRDSEIDGIRWPEVGFWEAKVRAVQAAMYKGPRTPFGGRHERHVSGLDYPLM
jgi:hypothetical protein